jgi:hypothetical protein
MHELAMGLAILALIGFLFVILLGFSVDSLLEEDEFRDKVNEC